MYRGIFQVYYLVKDICIWAKEFTFPCCVQTKTLNYYIHVQLLRVLALLQMPLWKFLDRMPSIFVKKLGVISDLTKDS